MELASSFERLLAYDHWANGQALESVEKLASPPALCVQTMAHILGAQSCWIIRMTAGRDPPGIENWDEEQTLASLRRYWQDDLPAQWAAFFADANLSDPARHFTFIDWLGNTSRPTRVEDALLHVFVHSPHHRGQVATQVRAAGGEPAQTEFLRAVRAQAV
jgi:uncharacterized damage-inducible protein DinB